MPATRRRSCCWRRCGLPIDRLEPYLDLKPTPAERARLLTLIDARVSLRLPAPYLVGAAYMHGVRFHADRRALIPRSFIGDMLADGVLPIGDPRKVKRVLDLCTGSGCLAILAALRLPAARASTPPICRPARWRWRGATSATHRLDDRIALHRGDLFQPLGGKRYDLIISNPPYVDAARHGEACRPSTVTSRAWRWRPATTASTWCAASSPRRRGI